jgi:tetratricopeptide (TPR) repeat protein
MSRPYTLLGALVSLLIAAAVSANSGTGSRHSGSGAGNGVANVLSNSGEAMPEGDVEEYTRFSDFVNERRAEWAVRFRENGGLPGPQDWPAILQTAPDGLNMEVAERWGERLARQYALPNLGPGRGGLIPGITAPPISNRGGGKPTQTVPPQSLPPVLTAPSGGAGPDHTGGLVISALASARPESPRARATNGYYLLGTGDNTGSIREFTYAMQNGYATPEVATGLGQAAYNAGDYKLAGTAAALALKMQPDNRVAFSISKLSEGRTSKVSIPNHLTGPGGLAPDAGEGLKAATGGFADSNGGAGFVGSGTPGYNGLAPGAAKAPDPGGLSPVQASAAATENARHALVLKDYPLAVVHASKAIEFNAENAQALNYRAIAYNRMQRYSDAVHDASAALSLAPGNAPALQTRSWAFAQQGQYREALQDAESTLASDPRNAYAYQNKAFALAGMKDRAGMLDALRLSAALDARFKGQYERALQMPQDQDLTLLFAESAPAAAAAPARPAATPKRFARMALLSGTGGLLIALGILHVVSASWREKVRMTVRRVLSSDADVADAGAAATPHPGSSAFWTQYDLVKEIGMGGMGVVYEAKDRSLERRVAVKKMRDEIRIEPHEKQRFINEAKTVAGLRHPNIVDIYSIVEDGADVYLVFEYVEGHTLHDRLRSQGAYAFGEGLKLFRDICGAVEHAHSSKVIHRDLKPSNVMVTPEGRVKVMDFGVARQAKDALTKVSMTNTVVGTPPYMAPEQEQGTVRKESDVYALGVCFYEMLTGQLPFTGAGSGMLLNKINGKHIPPTQRVPSLPASLDAVMAKALHPDPEKRHHSAAELLADLERLA